MTREIPLISVVMATRNPGAKLAATLNSLLGQGGRWELLAVDGGSNDGTLNLLRETAAQSACIRWWSEPDRGVFDAFNTGISRAHGRYIYFLPAGDRLRPGAFEQVSSQLPDHDYGFVDGRVFLEEHGFERPTGAISQHDLVMRNIPHQGVFYGRELFEWFGPYNLRYPIVADHPFNICCFADPRVEVRYIDCTIADFEGGGVSSTQRDPNIRRGLPLLVWRHMGFRLAARVVWSWWILPPRRKRALRLAVRTALRVVGYQFQ